MYVPFLRGRAAEIRALSSCQAIIKRGHVLPILDPVNSTREWWSKLRRFDENEVPCAIIINPENGKFAEDYSELRDAVDTDFGESKHFLPTYHVRHETSESHVASFLAHYSERPVGIVLASDHIRERTFERILSEHDDVRLVAVTARLPQSYVPQSEACQVIIEDAFKPAPANAKYPPDRFFSDLPRTYLEEDFDGFGDYTTLGQVYDPGGWIPSAVAIHFTYESRNNVVRVRHFVSEDREAQVRALVPKKTKQALDQLNAFVKEVGAFCGAGCSEFLAAARQSDMPGLVKLKEWSIQHHIELMNHILARHDKD